MVVTSRKFPRVPLNLTASVKADGPAVSCRLLQLGPGGALMEVPVERELPESFSLTFALPGTPAMTVEAVPRFRRERGGYRPNHQLPTLGCQFRGLTEAKRQAIEAFVVRQREALRQLQFTLALSPPPPRVAELMRQVGAAGLSPDELKQFVRWCSSLS
jgi:hypothetical protein